MQELWSSSIFVPFPVESVTDTARPESRDLHTDEGGAEPDRTIPLTISHVFFFFRIELQAVECWIMVKAFCTLAVSCCNKDVVDNEPVFVLVGALLLGGLLESSLLGGATLATVFRFEEVDKDVWLASVLDEALCWHPCSFFLSE